MTCLYPRESIPGGEQCEQSLEYEAAGFSLESGWTDWKVHTGGL